MNALPNSDGLINWLRQPGTLLNQPQKSIRESNNLLIKSCGTRTWYRQDSFIVTRRFSSIYTTGKKRGTATQTATQLNRRAVIVHSGPVITPKFALTNAL